MQLGRPATYTTPEDLEKELDRYFKETEIKEWTVTWLAIFLGFTTRQALINYECKPDFVDAIKKAKLKVEYSYELDLKEKGNSWTIFALKNFDWKDKTEAAIEHSGWFSLLSLSEASKDVPKLNPFVEE